MVVQRNERAMMVFGVMLTKKHGTRWRKEARVAEEVEKWHSGEYMKRARGSLAEKHVGTLIRRYMAARAGLQPRWSMAISRCAFLCVPGRHVLCRLLPARLEQLPDSDGSGRVMSQSCAAGEPETFPVPRWNSWA
ncbi:hypothetical protein NDU88_006277 [Pleurodeles waltl]|uniref:Uncharacterized protein n=1 Tax=Pleurodeles waltl TaxID=8319 RepID=A0AAV7N0G8_PLEWA|nr:hypothetical protein NDU88_006277 [Pleurodeles waltl]